MGHVTWQESDPDLLQTSSRQIGIYKSTIGLILRTMPEAFKMLKTGQRARSSASRDPGHLLSSEICKWKAWRLEKEEMIRLRDLSANTLTCVPYTEDQIMSMVRKGKQRGHIPGVGRVLAGRGRDVISINEPRCTHTYVDVDELESQHEVGGGNESGGGRMMSQARIRTPSGMRRVRTCYIWDSMEYKIKNVFGLRWNRMNHEAEVFHVSNDDTAVAQRWLVDKQPQEKTNTDCLVKEREKVHLGIKVGANITVTGVPGQKGAEGNVAEKNKGVYES
ncbi:hypothetical protein Tco_0976785 [Tanacetum coccineum]|uniref:Uncharacterized protein n=1 Tax=Tanacetum coccineum TaxID=301880 RepID=A0ABQ5EIB5_9ASTR